MFDELHKVHVGAQNATAETDPMVHCAKFLWVVIQAHDVMQTFKDLHFSHHPVTAPTVNYHVHRTMATKASHSKMMDQIANLTKQVSHFDSLRVFVEMQHLHSSSH